MEWVYNKGKRTWTIALGFGDDGLPNETVTIGPAKAAELPDEIAKRYVERYSKDLIFGQGSNNRSQKQRILELEAENAELRAQIEKLTPANVTESVRAGNVEMMDRKQFLLKRAEELNFEVDKRWGVDKIQTAIDEASNE